MGRSTRAPGSMQLIPDGNVARLPRIAQESLEVTCYRGLLMSDNPRIIAVLFLSVAMGQACRHDKTDKTRSTAVEIDSVAASAIQPLAPPSSAAPASTLPSPAASSNSPSLCNEQAPQDFLVNAHYNGRSLPNASALREWKDAVARSIRYRTEQYGYYSGFGSYGWNKKQLYAQMHTVKFFGLPVRLHERVIPALRCVETALRSDCAQTPYQPKALSGLRERNTYLDGDVSNHVYGIAIDIDPMQNPCCNCIEPWKSSPRCQGKKTDLERMDMPACWITVFERFGFYWLGHDALKDTMHFEFLGDPEQVAKGDAGAPR
jgi:hypothetical protein